MPASLQFSADSVQPSPLRELFRLLFDDAITAPYSVVPGGQRFLVRSPIDQESKPFEVILNWPALLRPASN